MPTGNVPTSVLDPARRRHPLLDGRYPEAQLYLQHRDGRWGRYLYTGASGTFKVAFPNSSECTSWWDRASVCASVVTPRRIW